jgi:hypothetical protein
MKISPMAKDGDKTSPLAWPVFPESCPNLHDAAEEGISDAAKSHNLNTTVSFDENIEKGKATP